MSDVLLVALAIVKARKAWERPRAARRARPTSSTVVPIRLPGSVGRIVERIGAQRAPKAPPLPSEREVSAFLAELPPMSERIKVFRGAVCEAPTGPVSICGAPATYDSRAAGVPRCERHGGEEVEDLARGASTAVQQDLFGGGLK